MTFSTLALSPDLLRAIEHMGFENPTDIQAKTIPVILEGHDVIGRSQTGSGKTVAFGVPAVECVETSKGLKDVPQVLILCPTRELAMQAAGEMRKLTRYKQSIKVAELCGGMPMPRQITQLKSGANVIIGTPGRVMDHLRRRTLKLDMLKMIVLDEADEMLSMGFKEDIETILEDVPTERQTILFSATMPPAILQITKTYQNDPILIEVGNRQKTVDSIKQSFYDIPMGRKMDALHLLLRYYRPRLSMIFCNTKVMVEELTQNLQSHGFTAEGLHGDMKQSQRTTVLNSFKNGRSTILVATDVAARGIDVDGIDYVFNYDIPQNTEYYIHRIGRTGRAGKDGTAISLCSGRRQVFGLQDILRMTKSKAERAYLPTTEEIHLNTEAANIALIEDKMKEELSANSLKLADTLVSSGADLEKVIAALIEMQFGSQFVKIDNIRQERKEQSGPKDPNRVYAKVHLTIGREDRVSPKHIVGAITEKTELSGRDIGKIEIYDDHSIVNIPKENLDETLKIMEGSKISGKVISATFKESKDGRDPHNRPNQRSRPRSSSHKKDYRSFDKKPGSRRR